MYLDLRLPELLPGGTLRIDRGRQQIRNQNYQRSKYILLLFRKKRTTSSREGSIRQILVRISRANKLEVRRVIINLQKSLKNIRNTSTFIRKRQILKYYLSTKPRIIRSNSNPLRRRYLNLYILYQKRNLRYFATILRRTLRKDLFENLNHRQNIQYYLYLIRIVNLGYILNLESLIRLQERIVIYY